MTTLHMETDNVLLLAKQIEQMVENTRAQMQSLQQSANSVEWEGHNREEFIHEIQGILRQIDGVLDSGLVLGDRVVNEVVEWERMSQPGRNRIGDVRVLPWEPPIILPDPDSLQKYVGSMISIGLPGSLYLIDNGLFSPFPTGGTNGGYTQPIWLEHESRAYAGYMNGDFTLDKAVDFIIKDPFGKPHFDISAKFWDESVEGGVALDSASITGKYGKVSAGIGVVEESVKSSAEFSEGAFNINSQYEGGVYLDKVKYDANFAGVGVAAAGFVGVAGGLGSSVTWDPAKGEAGAKADAEVFVGAKAEGSASYEVGGIEGKATGSVSYGVGYTARADVGFTEGHMHAEVEVGAALGLGAEGGISIDIDVFKTTKTIVDLGEKAVEWLD